MSLFARSDPQSKSLLKCHHDEESPMYTGTGERMCPTCCAILGTLPEACPHPPMSRSPNQQFCTQCQTPIAVAGDGVSARAAVPLSHLAALSLPLSNDVASEHLVSHLKRDPSGMQAVRLLADVDRCFAVNGLDKVSPAHNHA